jgi:hypothetical protein
MNGLFELSRFNIIKICTRALLLGVIGHLTVNLTNQFDKLSSAASNLRDGMQQVVIYRALKLQLGNCWGRTMIKRVGIFFHKSFIEQCVGETMVLANCAVYRKKHLNYVRHSVSVKCVVVANGTVER